MMDESEIRQRFAQLREADRESAPGFAQTYASARSRRSSPAMQRVRPLVIAAAAAVVIAAVWIANARSFSPHTVTPTIAPSQHGARRRTSSSGLQAVSCSARCPRSARPCSTK